MNKNTYSTKKFYNDLAKLRKETEQIAVQATNNTLQQTASENAFLMSFDEVEAIPYGVGNNGSIVIVANTADPIELADIVSEMAVQAMDTLSQEVINKMKGVLK